MNPERPGPGHEPLHPGDQVGDALPGGTAAVENWPHEPAVTVVIAAHTDKRWASILAAVESVQKQEFKPEQIVIAVDHNPALADRLRHTLPEVRVAENSGPVKGSSPTRNAGVATVTTELTAFLDDDETANPDWLERLIEPFANPDVVGTGGRYDPVWLAGKPAWFPDQFAWVVGGGYEGMPVEASVVRNVWSGNMAVRTATFNAVGGFRVDFGKIGVKSQPEDTDLCLRMSELTASGHWLYLPNAVIYHEVPANRSTFRFFIRRCFSEGRAKIEMADRLGIPGSLQNERSYIRQTLLVGVAHHLREGWSSLSRAAAIILGIAAAGAGAATANAARWRRKSRSAEPEGVPADPAVRAPR